ncbi:hypothetical protein ICA16_03505 [Pseudomonas anatoliensis]|uniref:hypothetical protein n=1 Tax=Pseudomonas anatoliensis TaxID=2710589 RepID=UPI001B32B10A|nr:hypothetical protein [Pseudomonas anatoliensis]MBP5954723.1 hypothetical protein [Pseudomonas anatoliensis]
MSTEPFDPVPADETGLNLYAPQLPDSNTSVVGADCGIAIAFYELRPNGAKVIINPYLGQEPLDTVSLNLNGELRVASGQTHSKDDPITLHIPKNKLRSEPGYINELTYTVKRTTGAEETSPFPLTILYNAIRPGIEDQIKGDEGHSELELILPRDVIEDGIDADHATQGVQVYFSYPYCRAYDKILLNCNGHDVYRDVHPDEAPSIPTSVPTKIGLLLDKEVFERAGDHPQFSFSYTVSDQIGNGADLNSPWSAAIPVDVDLSSSRMGPPDIAEDADDPYDAPDTIDLNKLGSKDLTIQVHVFAPLWALHDTIRVKYVATTSAGVVAEHVSETTVGRIPFVHRPLIPNAKVIADSAVRVTYEQVRSGVVTARSKNARARVVVKPVIISVKNSFGEEMENGGTVSDNKVMLAGTALAGAVLHVYEGTTFVEEVQTDSKYKWQSSFIKIAIGERRFTVKEKNGNQFVSERWLLERLALSIERTQMKLNGFSVKVPQWPKTWEDSIGNTAIRTPIGGVPPYDFASSDPLTVPVTAAGKVVGLKQGVASIYVTDQEGTTLSYLVAVTNVYRLEISNTLLDFYEADAWRISLGGRHTHYNGFTNDLIRTYVPPARDPYLWCCETKGRWGVYMRENYSFNTTYVLHKWAAWCLVPI